MQHARYDRGPDRVMEGIASRLPSGRGAGSGWMLLLLLLLLNHRQASEKRHVGRHCSMRTGEGTHLLGSRARSLLAPQPPRHPSQTPLQRRSSLLRARRLQSTQRPTSSSHDAARRPQRHGRRRRRSPPRRLDEGYAPSPAEAGREPSRGHAAWLRRELGRLAVVVCWLSSGRTGGPRWRRWKRWRLGR